MATQPGTPNSHWGTGDMRSTAYGRDVAFNPQLQRMEGQSGAFGQQYGGALGQQQGVFAKYGQMAAGGGPSLAQSQLQGGMAVANRSAVQNAMQARGGNAAGAVNAATTASTSLGGQAATQAAMLRQQEQMMAMEGQAGMANQMAQQGLQGQLGMESLYQGALGQQLDANLAGRQLRTEERGAKLDRAKGIKGMILPDLGSDERIKTGIKPSGQGGGTSEAGANGIQTASGVLGALGGTLGKLAPLIALSDENAKKNIVPGNLQASQAVGELNSSEFEYKAGYGQPAGRRFGVMAQDMQQAYPQAVVDTPQGLGINVAQGLGLNLAATSEQEQRLRKIEAAMGQRQQGVFGGGA